jgi:mevalonate kinase
MILKLYSDQVFSKVILCGEHSVLRGGTAVVTPMKAHSLKFEIYKNDEGLCFEYSEAVKPFEILIEGTFVKAFELLEIPQKSVKAKISVETLVPLGKGLGGSAALCVFVARSVKALGLLGDRSEFSFAVELEYMFHGESSGVDIAGCLSEHPQIYVRGKVLKPLRSNLKGFIFGLSDSGENGDTEECITKVLRIKSENKNLFYSLDSDMDQASKLLSQAIEKGDLPNLILAFTQASRVFKSWGLVTDEMKKMSESLKNSGALVTKPTGSGLGGCILSVWRESDVKIAEQNCISTFII